MKPTVENDLLNESESASAAVDRNRGLTSRPGAVRRGRERTVAPIGEVDKDHQQTGEDPDRITVASTDHRLPAPLGRRYRPNGRGRHRTGLPRVRREYAQPWPPASECLMSGRPGAGAARDAPRTTTSTSSASRTRRRDPPARDRAHRARGDDGRLDRTGDKPKHARAPRRGARRPTGPCCRQIPCVDERRAEHCGDRYASAGVGCRGTQMLEIRFPESLVVALLMLVVYGQRQSCWLTTTRRSWSAIAPLKSDGYLSRRTKLPTRPVTCRRPAYDRAVGVPWSPWRHRWIGTCTCASDHHDGRPGIRSARRRNRTQSPAYPRPCAISGRPTKCTSRDFARQVSRVTHSWSTLSAVSVRTVSPCGRIMMPRAVTLLRPTTDRLPDRIELSARCTALPPEHADRTPESVRYPALRSKDRPRTGPLAVPKPLVFRCATIVVLSQV